MTTKRATKVFIEPTDSGKVLVDTREMVEAGDPAYQYDSLTEAAWSVAAQWPDVPRAMIFDEDIMDAPESDAVVKAFDAAWREATTYLRRRQNQEREISRAMAHNHRSPVTGHMTGGDRGGR